MYLNSEAVARNQHCWKLPEFTCFVSSVLYLLALSIHYVPQKHICLVIR